MLNKKSVISLAVMATSIFAFGVSAQAEIMPTASAEEMAAYTTDKKFIAKRKASHFYLKRQLPKWEAQNDRARICASLDFAETAFKRAQEAGWKKDYRNYKTDTGTFGALYAKDNCSDFSDGTAPATLQKTYDEHTQSRLEDDIMYDFERAFRHVEKHGEDSFCYRLSEVDDQHVKLGKTAYDHDLMNSIMDEEKDFKAGWEQHNCSRFGYKLQIPAMK